MKLIIDIYDKTYEDVKNFYDNLGEFEVIGEYEYAIANGVPLPKKPHTNEYPLFTVAIEVDPHLGHLTTAEGWFPTNVCFGNVVFAIDEFIQLSGIYFNPIPFTQTFITSS